ncbi:hypothetical protein HQQ81_16105 [Microbacteriaceae bacterium VKM Ac-2854]|nr:hypothetical protein [Microbacteriaceae bacterium VKM Ac-2854]
MSRRIYEFVVGIICLVGGFLLWSTTQHIVTPVFDLSTIGVVLMFVGGAGILWSLVTSNRSARGDRDR